MALGNASTSLNHIDRAGRDRWAPETWRAPVWRDRVNFPLCLAPMVGLSHAPLRQLLRGYLPAGAKTIWPTEMLNSRKIPHEVMGETPETYKFEGEDGLVPQILGNDEASIKESVRKLEAWGATGIDINMGCPVQKALRHNYGVALMGDPGYAAEVVAMTVRNTTLPVSVKLRAGENGDQQFLLNFVKGLSDAGASWITLHPRTPEQQRRGKADWSQIRRLKEAVTIPIVGNGDIQVADDVFRMLDETGCDLVMAGRALAARPWMLWQVGERLGWAPPEGREGRAPATPEEEGAEYGRALLRLIDLCDQAYEQNYALRKIRFHLRTTAVWLQFGHTLAAVSTKVQTLSDLRGAVAEFFAVEQSMSQRTELRQ